MTPWLGAAVVGSGTGVALAVAGRIARCGDRRRPLHALGEPGRRVEVRRWSAAAVELIRTVAPVARWQQRRDAAARTALLPEFVDALVRSARSGAALPDAAREAAAAVGEPLVGELARVDRDVAFGLSWVDAMDAWASRSGDADVRLVSVACRLGVEMGRGTADALAGVATTLSDRRDLAGEARTASAQATASAVLLTALPAVVLVVLALVDPSSVLPLFTSPLGWSCLLAAVALDAAGLAWMCRLVGAIR